MGMLAFHLCGWWKYLSGFPQPRNNIFLQWAVWHGWGVGGGGGWGGGMEEYAGDGRFQRHVVATIVPDILFVIIVWGASVFLCTMSNFNTLKSLTLWPACLQAYNQLKALIASEHFLISDHGQNQPQSTLQAQGGELLQRNTFLQMKGIIQEQQKKWRTTVISMEIKWSGKLFLELVQNGVQNVLGT